MLKEAPVVQEDRLSSDNNWLWEKQFRVQTLTFTLVVKDQILWILIVYVYDLIITRNYDDFIDEFKQKKFKAFESQDNRLRASPLVLSNWDLVGVFNFCLMDKVCLRTVEEVLNVKLHSIVNTNVI